MARVAVLTLEEPPATREQYGYGSQFSGKLDAAFRKSRRFDMVNRSEVAAIIKEKNLSESEYSAPEGAKRLGELLNVDYLIVGFVGPDKDHTMFNVSAKMVDTITGKEMAAVEGTTEQKEGIRGFSKLAADLVKQLVSQHDTTPRQG